MIRCPHCSAENADEARFCGSCGRATSATEPATGGGTASAAPDLVGREIGGRYRVLAKLGEGGMGAVYRGEQISLKRGVAIKLLHPALSADASLVRRFNAEAELAAKLSHPNTVNIYDFGQDADGTLFIAMELLEGRSLRQTLTAEGPMPPRRALHIATQIASSIADAHGHGIVHRDLKPDNVMLTARGKATDIVRVLDFGIAKLRDDQRATQQAMTRAGDLVGTPQYMAPEQIRGDKVDGRADVYALGAVLYEMLTGRLVFEGPSLMAILSRHLLDEPEPPTRRRPELRLPAEIDELVLSMLAKDPDRRLPSMDAASERIATVAMALAGTPTPSGGMFARPPGVTQTLPPGVMRAPPPGAATPVPPRVQPTPYTPTPYTPPYVQPPQPPYPQPPYPYQPPQPPRPMPVAAKAGVPAWVWIVATVAVLGAIGLVVAATQKGDGAGTGSATGTAAPTPPRPPPTGDTVSAGAYRVTLPLGFISTTPFCPQLGPQQSYTGTIGGDVVTITIGADATDITNADLATYDQACQQIAATCFGGVRTSSRLESGHGDARYRCTVEGLGSEADGVFYATPTGSLLAFFASTTDAYDRLARERDAQLEQRISGP